MRAAWFFRRKLVSRKPIGIPQKKCRGGKILFLGAIALLSGCAKTKIVTITTNPDDAIVYLDGTEAGLSPVIKKLSFENRAEFVATAKKEGYNDKNIPISLEPRERTIYYIELKEISKKVNITSNPDAASIYIDGMEIGTTPLTKEIPFREKQEIKAVAKKEGYAEGNITLNLQPKDKTDYHIDLERVSKKVTIVTNPGGAAVYLDGAEAGISPLTKDLRFKEKPKVTVVTKKEGYRDGNTAIELEPVSQTEYRLEMERISKKVTITSNPTGAKLYLDGVETGITPLTKELSFREKPEIAVTAKKDGFKDGSLALNIKPYDTTEYKLDLGKIDTVSVELLTVEPRSTDKGVKLVMVRKPTLAYLEDIERSPNVMSVTRVISNEDSTLQIGAPALSPSEDSLLYPVFAQEKGSSSYCNIWKQSIGSSKKTMVTYGKWQDLFPCFTPNGQQMVFSSDRGSPNPGLWRIKVGSGAGFTKITNSLSEDYAPSVSPDGSVIAYASNPLRADESQVWTISMDGNLPTQLREGESPQISPDGKKILFVRKNKDSKKKQIWLMNIDGSEETMLTQNTDYDTIDPKWSRDGNWIVFASDEGVDSNKMRNFDIWLMTADGSHKTQLTTNGSMDDSPCWDRNGEFIYFRSNRGGVWNIWRFKPIMP